MPKRNCSTVSVLATRADMSSHRAWGGVGWGGGGGVGWVCCRLCRVQLRLMGAGLLQRSFPTGGRASPHLGPDQGLEAGLEVVKSAAIEPRHLIQELFVLGFEVFPDRPQLLSGLENKTPVSLKRAGCGDSEALVAMVVLLPPPASPAVPGGAWPAPGRSSPCPRTSPPWPAVSGSLARPAPAASLPC